MEEGVAVLDHVPLVVLHPPDSARLLGEVDGAAALRKDHRVLGGHGQLVHLAGAGRANAAGGKSETLTSRGKRSTVISQAL